MGHVDRIGNNAYERALRDCRLAPTEFQAFEEARRIDGIEGAWQEISPEVWSFRPLPPFTLPRVSLVWHRETYKLTAGTNGSDIRQCLSGAMRCPEYRPSGKGRSKWADVGANVGGFPVETSLPELILLFSFGLFASYFDKTAPALEPHEEWDEVMAKAMRIAIPKSAVDCAIVHLLSPSRQYMGFGTVQKNKMARGIIPVIGDGTTETGWMLVDDRIDLTIPYCVNTLELLADDDLRSHPGDVVDNLGGSFLGVFRGHSPNIGTKKGIGRFFADDRNFVWD